MNAKFSFFALALFSAIVAVFLIQAIHAERNATYDVHEWGTFTSVQGSDGVQLDWQAPVADLPDFVYDWTKPGFGRIFGRSILSKVELPARQRMETPVIYFYGEENLVVDVTVRFPRGLITEWFPQASQIGPSSMPKNLAGTPDEAYAVADSRIHWAGLNLFPAKAHTELNERPPSSNSRNHYFAARQTDSDFVAAQPDGQIQYEKFLFYRGVGNFSTPLLATMDSAGDVTLTNTGATRLAHVFVLNVNQGHGQLMSVPHLETGVKQSVTLAPGESATIEELKARIERDMANTLVSEGLFPREAAAMVNTWKDSWFTEEGLRVLYVLPAAWTDATLPMTLVPAPRSLVRVMVGRAEIISPAVEQRLRDEITRAGQGDYDAAAQLRAELEQMGRFGGTAWKLATKGMDATLVRSASDLLGKLKVASL